MTAEEREREAQEDMQEQRVRQAQTLSLCYFSELLLDGDEYEDTYC